MSELWEGYDNQDFVVLEDIDPFHVKLGYHLKIWADRYSFRGRVLYGSIVLRPKVFVVTSQYHPNEIWGADSKTAEAICDRFKITKLERMMEVDNTLPKKKNKPALRRADGRETEFWKNATQEHHQKYPCMICNLGPCICDILEDTEEEENEIVID